MLESMIPMVVCTGMFAMIFGIVYIKSRENMALIEKGINPHQTKYRPRPFVNLKWGLLLLGCGLGLLFAFIIDSALPDHSKPKQVTEKKVVIKNHSADTAKAKIDTTKAQNSTGSASVKNGKHIVVTKHGKTTTIESDVNGKLESLESTDDNDSTSNGPTVVNNNFGVTIGHGDDDHDRSALYFALIAIGGGLGLFFSYRIEKKEWLDKMDKYNIAE